MKPSDFEQIRETMKARKISGAQIARDTGRSSSQINSILRGDYPFYGGYGLPKYLYEYLVSNKLLSAENGTYLIQAKL
jgi:transcriptional regulator with XRE-family HTH domain